jgi:hypothetical protein
LRHFRCNLYDLIVGVCDRSQGQDLLDWCNLANHVHIADLLPTSVATCTETIKYVTQSVSLTWLRNLELRLPPLPPNVLVLSDHVVTFVAGVFPTPTPITVTQPKLHAPLPDHPAPILLVD